MIKISVSLVSRLTRAIKKTPEILVRVGYVLARSPSAKHNNAQKKIIHKSINALFQHCLTEVKYGMSFKVPLSH